MNVSSAFERSIRVELKNQLRIEVLRMMIRIRARCAEMIEILKKGARKRARGNGVRGKRAKADVRAETDAYEEDEKCKKPTDEATGIRDNPIKGTSTTNNRKEGSSHISSAVYFECDRSLMRCGCVAKLKIKSSVRTSVTVCTPKMN